MGYESNMDKRAKGLRVLLLLVLGTPEFLTGANASSTRPSGDGQAMSRADLKVRLEKSVRLGGPLGRSGAKLSDIKKVADDEIGEAVDLYLPTVVSTSVSNGIDFVVSQPVEIDFADQEYIQALVRLRVVQIPMMLKFVEKYPPLSADEKVAISNSLVVARDRFEAIAVEELARLKSGGLGESLINKAFNEKFSILKDNIGRDVFSVSLTTPVTPHQITIEMTDFRSRLHGSVERIRTDLEAASVGTTQPTEGMNQANVDRALRPVVAWAIAAFLRDSQDKERADYCASMIRSQPLVVDAANRLSKITMQLLQVQAAKQ